MNSYSGTEGSEASCRSLGYHCLGVQPLNLEPYCCSCASTVKSGLNDLLQEDI